MRKSLLILVAVVTLVGSSGAATRASLHLLRTNPFTVKGTGFQAREHVVVTAFLHGRKARVVNADGDGGFRVVFGPWKSERCSGYSVTAVGSRGSHASIRFLPLCPVPPRGSSFR
ncbi:MAG: hypothetical protein WBB74_08340 [Gaiellaceae bacterium]